MQSPFHTKAQAFSCIASSEGPQPQSSSHPPPLEQHMVKSQLVGLGKQGRRPKKGAKLTALHGDPTLTLASLALGSD